MDEAVQGMPVGVVKGAPDREEAIGPEVEAGEIVDRVDGEVDCVPLGEVGGAPAEVHGVVETIDAGGVMGESAKRMTVDVTEGELKLRKLSCRG